MKTNQNHFQVGVAHSNFRFFEKLLLKNGAKQIIVVTSVLLDNRLQPKLFRFAQ